MIHDTKLQLLRLVEKKKKKIKNIVVVFFFPKMQLLLFSLVLSVLFLNQGVKIAERKKKF